MLALFHNLRIGEKIGLSFGLVGLLFLLVIWQYHRTLATSLEEYRNLLDIHEAKKSHALQIERYMLAARVSEKAFRIDRDTRHVEKALVNVDAVLEQAAQMAAVDEDGRWMAGEITGRIITYRDHFKAVVAAWKTKGLDHDKGLQGRFRDTVHQLQDKVARFHVGELYLKLLQVRKSEKDLGLHREEQYREKVLQLLEEFKAQTQKGTFDNGFREKLAGELTIYETTFREYATGVLENNDVQGGKGQFRQAAIRIEDLFNTYHVPGLEREILELRRREKDYLLRGDKGYVEMVRHGVETIRAMGVTSGLSTGDRNHLVGLLESYERDFLALVAQNDHIIQLTGEMNQAVDRITPLIDKNVQNANLIMVEKVKQINKASLQNAHLMLWIVAIASMMGIFFAWLITVRIRRPLHRIAGALGRLAHGDPANRIPHWGDRDEVDAMAGAVNRMMDHTERLIKWSMVSMREDESHLRTVVDRLVPGFLLTDSEGRILAASKGAAGIFGYTPDDLFEMSINTFAPFLFEPGAQHGDDFSEGEEISGLHRSGERIPLWVTTCRIESKNLQARAVLVLDITARKEAERELRRAKNARRDLLIIMGHDMRTKVVEINRQVAFLLESGRTGRHHHGETIRKEGEELATILDVVLGYADMEGDKIEEELRPFELKHLLNSVAAFFAEFARRKGLALSVRFEDGLPRTVIGHAGHLRHILVNLLSNAVKYTERGEVMLAVALDKGRPNHKFFRFTVRDTGIGMSAKQLQKVFDPDYVEEASHKYRRTRQSLAITHKMIRVMEGEIKVESQLGEGSTFSVSLPLEVAAL